MPVDQNRLYGRHELAAALGIHPTTLNKWIERGSPRRVPAPDARLACGPVWRRRTIDTLLRDTYTARMLTNAQQNEADAHYRG